jgi:hypothetical protein
MNDASKLIHRKTFEWDSESPRQCLQQGNRHIGVSTLSASAGPCRAFAWCNLMPHLSSEGSARTEQDPLHCTFPTNCHGQKHRARPSPLQHTAPSRPPPWRSVAPTLALLLWPSGVRRWCTANPASRTMEAVESPRRKDHQAGHRRAAPGKCHRHHCQTPSDELPSK